MFIIRWTCCQPSDVLMVKRLDGSVSEMKSPPRFKTLSEDAKDYAESASGLSYRERTKDELLESLKNSMEQVLAGRLQTSAGSAG